MKITTHTSVPVSAPYRELFDNAETDNFFSSRRWFENYLQTVSDAGVQAVFLGVESDGGEVLAVLPLQREPRQRPWQPSRLKSLANYYTCLYEPALSKDRDRAVAALDRLVGHLIEERADWDVLDLRPLVEDAWYVSHLEATFAARGFPVNRYFVFGNWYLDAAGLDFDGYFQTRRKKMRSTVRSKTSQLQRQSTLEIEIIEDARDRQEVIAEYRQVYGESWKQAEPYAAFIPGLIGLLSEQGGLRLGLLRVDGAPVAVQLWFVYREVAYIFKLAYDSDWSKYSVGTLLTMKLMEHVLDKDKVRCVDFLSGDDQYKNQWMSHRRERIGLEIINPRSPRGLVLQGRRVLRRVKKRLSGA